MEKNYQSHLATLMTRYETILEQLDFDTIVVSSGGLLGVANDDQTYPYIAQKMAQQWLPCEVKPNTFVVLKPGKNPHLIWPAHQDFGIYQQLNRLESGLTVGQLSLMSMILIGKIR
jgi:hypothetical protein